MYYSGKILCLLALSTLCTCSAVDSQSELDTLESLQIQKTNDAFASIVLSDKMVVMTARGTFIDHNAIQACMKDGLPHTLSPEERYHRRPRLPKDRSKLPEEYLRIKQQIIDLVVEQDCKLNVEIQYGVQELLRTYLLLQTDQRSKVEAKELLLLYLPTNPIDMDILADTYLFSHVEMTPQEAERVRNYIWAMYTNNLTTIPQKIQQAKEKLARAPDKYNENFQIMHINSLNQRIESNAYAGEVMGFKKIER